MVKQSPSNMCFLNQLKKTSVVFKLNSWSVTSTEWDFHSIYHFSVAFHLMNFKIKCSVFMNLSDASI